MCQILKVEKIGGFGQIIEIDQCQIGRRKYHRGRIPNEIWLFGGINRHDKKQVFIEQVPDRKKNTLLPEIVKHIMDGSVIMSDGWGHTKKSINILPTIIFNILVLIIKKILWTRKIKIYTHKISRTYGENYDDF